jgi:pentapeptide repeat protein
MATAPGNEDISDRIKRLTEEKLAREVAKLDREREEEQRTYALEKRKASAAVWAPIATVASILAAILVVVLQNSAKSTSDEDTYWRDTIKAIANTKEGDQKASYLRSLLKPFLTSDRYRTYARGLALRELADMKDSGSFDDMFAAVFPKPGTRDFEEIRYVARTLYQQNRESNDSLKTLKPGPDRVEAQRQMEVKYAELRTICQGLVQAMRDNPKELRRVSGGETGGQAVRGGGLDLSDIYFRDCDLSNLDLSDADLKSSVFSSVKLNGTNLVGIKYDEDMHYLWAATVWWRAKSIDAALLSKLIKNYEPNHFYDEFPNVYPDFEVIKEDEYKENVERLCAAAQIDCSHRAAFRPPPPPTS